MGVGARIILRLEPRAAFDTFVEELASALAVRGMRFDTGPNVRLIDGDQEIARVCLWQPGIKILLEWSEPDWQKEAKTADLELWFEPDKDGTRVTLDHAEWGYLFNDRGSELAGWFAGEVAAPLLQAMAPARFGDWVTDRTARRPYGAKARATYRDPIRHRPNFLAILNMLRLRPSDYLLEVGCGGVPWRISLSSRDALANS